MAPWVDQYGIYSCIMSLRTVLGPLGPCWALLDHFATSGDFGSFWCCFGAPSDSLMAPWVGQYNIIMCYVLENSLRATRTILGLVGPSLPLLVILCHFMSFWAILGAPWVPKCPRRWANMTYNHVLCPWELFQSQQDPFGPCKTIFATSDDFGPF